jgi:glyoxylase-like metal-dependent hydrolase (beta-lactamase superfamily II)
MSTKLDSGISRRRFLISTSTAATVGLLAPRDLFAQDDGLVQTARKTAATANTTVQKLRGNVSVLMGAGGNIAVLPGRDGKLLIDAGFAGARSKIADALASISSDPIKHLINTHWHFDHTDGNAWLHSADAVILAHANTRKHLSTTTRVESWNFTFPPSPPGAIPAEIFEDERTVQLNGTTIALKHYAPAHTDSDISVLFTQADIFHVADTFWNGYYPNSPSTATCWLALATEWRPSRNKANRSTKLSPQSLQPPQTRSGATALGALKTSSEMFSRAFEPIASELRKRRSD